MTSQREIARLMVKIEEDGAAQAAAEIATLEAVGRKADKATQDLNRSLRGTGASASQASGGFSKVTKELNAATKSAGLWQDAQGRWRSESGRFASDAEKAANGIKSLSKEGDKSRGALGRFFGGIGGGIGNLNKFFGSIGPLNGVLGALALTAATVGPLLLAASASAVALASALGPLVGLAPAAAVGLSALAQAAGVVALASMGVGDALQEQLQAHDKSAKSAISNADQQRAAARAISQAQEGVRTATQRVAAASEDLAAAEEAQRAAVVALGPARQQAKRDLEDMHAALATATITEKRAVLDLTEARKALAEASAPADTVRLADAQRTLTGTTLSEERAVLALTDARQALDDLMKPADALTVADAQDAVADATRGQTRAALDLVKAQEKAAAVNAPPANDLQKAQAALDLTKAQQKLNTVNADATATDVTRTQAALNLAKAQAKVDAISAGPATEADRAQAQLDLADAQNAVGDAARSSAHAQQALDKLQSPPSERELAKAKLDVADAEQSIRDATAGTAKAQRDVQDAMKGADPAAVAKATLDVAAAEQALATATRDRARLTKDVAGADKAGISGSAAMVQARQAVADADDRVTDAEKALAEAQHDTRRATQALHDAQMDAVSGMAAAGVAAADLNQKFDDLPPAAQAFVRVLQGLKPNLDALRATAAAGLFPGVTAGIQSAMKNFDPFKRVVGETAQALGDLAARAGELVGSAGFGKDIETVGHRNVLIIDRLGRAAIYVGDALRHVIVAAGPLTTWLAKVALGWAESADDAAEAGRRSGALAGFFQKTRNTLIVVASILGNLASAFFNVGKAAAPFGRDILKAIDDVTGKFAAWTKSIEGQKALQNFFKESNALMAEFLPVIGTALKSLGQMAFFVLPAYVAILKALGPLAGPLVQAFIALKLAATAAGAIAAVANPVGLVALAVVALGIAFTTAYKRSETFRDIVNGVWSSIKTAAEPVLEWLSVTAPLVWAVIKAAVKSTVEYVAKWLDKHRDDIDAFARAWENIATGVAWVITNVLVPAMEGVYRVVQAVWPGIKTSIEGSLKAIGGIIDVFSGIFTGDFGRIWDGIKAIFEGGIQQITGMLTAFGAGAAEALKLIGPLLLDAGTFLFGQIVDGLKALPGLLADAAVWLVTHLDDAIRLHNDVMATVGGWVLDVIVKGFKALAGLVADAAKWLFDTLKGYIDGRAAVFANRGKDILDWIVGGIKAVASGLSGAAGWVLDTLKGFLDGISANFANRGKDIIEWIAGGIRTVGETLAGVPGWLVDTLKTGFTAASAFFTNRGLDVIGWITGGITTLGEALKGAPQWLVDTLKTGLEAVTKGFKGLGGDVIGWIVDGMSDGANLLIGFLNKIVNAINKIPGVPDIPKIPDIEVDKKARGGAYGGGAFARTGGLVDRPITLMGEEAPRFAEYVIPTNPAYRPRAQKLAMQAAGAVGLAQGGVHGGAQMFAEGGINQYNHVFPRHNLGQPGFRIPPDDVMAIAQQAGLPGRPFEQIAHGESDYHPGIIGDDAAAGYGNTFGYGLWQNTTGVNGSAFEAVINGLGGWAQQLNPFKNAEAAKWLYDRGGISHWFGTKYLGKSGSEGGGVFSKIGDALSGVASIIADGPGKILGMLPSADGLGWLEGTGKYVLGKAKDWITDKITSLLPGSGGGGGLPEGIAGSVQKAIDFAKGLGFGQPSQGQLTGGKHAAGSFHYSGRAVDFGDAGHTGAQMVALFNGLVKHFGSSLNELFYDKMPRYIDDHKWVKGQIGGHADHIHAAFARGGMYGGTGLLGSYENGTNYVPQTGPYELHQGEAVVDAETNRANRSNAGAPTKVYLTEHGDVHIRDEADATVFTRKLGFLLA